MVYKLDWFGCYIISYKYLNSVFVINKRLVEKLSINIKWLLVLDDKRWLVDQLATKLV